ncbi:MAG: IS21 family transposase [Phycisphaerae bacterium]|nr:IS21 family transposase [Phycisphaerae bacterium]
MANRLAMADIDSIVTLHTTGHSQRQIAALLQVDRETVGRYVARASAQNRPNAPTGTAVRGEGVVRASGQDPPGAPTGTAGGDEAAVAAPGQNPPNAPTGMAGSGEAFVPASAQDAPTGTEAAASATPSGVTGQARTRSATGPGSECEPFRQQILAKLEEDLQAVRIHQDLVAEHHDQAPSYYSVRRYVARLKQKTPLPFRRLETGPGEEAQVDFGAGAPVRMADGKVRRPWVFRIVLSYSRKAYSEAVWQQSTEAFVQCLENAFRYFGGAVKRLVIDNLKAAVAQADWYDPEVHPKLQSFARHYGTVFLPTKPYTPRHKGKVESSVKYVKRNALKGRTFGSLAEENQFLLDWEARVADQRIHGTTKQQVQQRFEEGERRELLPLPAERFPFFHEARRAVHRDGFVEVDKAFYSAPPEYVGHRLWARWDGRLVRLFNDRWEQLIVHAKTEPGRFRSAPEHIPQEKVSAVERGTDALLRQIATIGPQTRQWAEATTQARGVEAVRVLVGLKHLAGKHPSEALEEACRVALSHGAYRLRTIRQLLKRGGAEQRQFEFLEEHPIIRPLSDYSLASLRQFRKERQSDEREVS